MAVQEQKQKQSVVLPSSYSYSPPSPLSVLFLSPFSSETSFLAAAATVYCAFSINNQQQQQQLKRSQVEGWHHSSRPSQSDFVVGWFVAVLRSRVAYV